RTHSPSPSRPSSEGRRRSSSQLNQPPHNVGDEEPPEDDFNSPAFQRSFMNTRDLMAKLETTLGSGNLHLESDSTIRRLREKAGELARFHCPPTRTVGFVGDSGVGKSSLLNSLLHHKGLARASSGGAACTCVATEYHYHEHDNFIIAIDLFTAEELQTQLTEMVRAYRRQHLGPPPIDLEEQKDMADGAEIAIDTFQAMFRGRNEFAQGRFVLSNEPEETILSTMLLWARELVYDNHGISDNMTVDTVKDCSEALANLTSERDNPQEPNINTGSPERNHRGHPHWPFIKKVRVYVNAHILSKGLILVDLPGLRDLNSARQNITERYILECDEVFAVCWIGRATSDAGVKAIFKLAREARLSNIGIVCTKLDARDPDEALTDWMGPERRELEGRIDRLKTAKDELRTIEALVDDLNELQRQDNLFDEEKVELEGLNFQKYAKERAIETLKFDQDRYLITTRNEMVKTRLRSEYRNTIPGGNVKVFCVSNQLYWEHQNSPKDKALPWLELSGIISLRKHCVAMVSESQLRIATNYMDNDIRSLINSIELWVQSGAGTETAERKALVRETLDVIEGRLKRSLGGRHSPFARIQRNFVEEFREKIYSGAQNPARWTNGAVEASNDWRNVRKYTLQLRFGLLTRQKGSYSAFCRHYGRFTKGVQGKDRDWNREAMEEMVRDIKPLWDVFERSMGGARTSELLISTHEVMKWAREYLATDTQLGEEDVSGEILHESLETREGLLINDLEDAFVLFDSKLGTLGNDLLESYRTSLMGQAMEGTYNRCKAESGTGCTERKCAIIRRTLSDKDFFKNIMRTLYSRFKELTTELENAVKTIVQRHFAAIKETMDILRDENVIAESERDGKFRRLVEEEV
ncbi:nuclear GTPase SLIP-GC 3, partial [Rhypophila decipiens]